MNRRKLIIAAVITLAIAAVPLFFAGKWVYEVVWFFTHPNFRTSLYGDLYISGWLQKENGASFSSLDFKLSDMPSDVDLQIRIAGDMILDLSELTYEEALRKVEQIPRCAAVNESREGRVSFTLWQTPNGNTSEFEISTSRTEEWFRLPLTQEEAEVLFGTPDKVVDIWRH